MSWTCPGHYKVYVHGRDSPGRPVHGHCPVPLPALLILAQNLVYLRYHPSLHHMMEVYPFYSNNFKLLFD